MKKIRDLNWFELWSDGARFAVYTPTKKSGEFNSYRRALEHIAAFPVPERGNDRGPMRHGRHIAKCLLAELM